MENVKLFTVEDAENFSIEEVWELYKKHVNASQVELLGAFGAGRDLVDYSEGCYIYLKNGKKILDLTGGIGVLNHGHNNNTILKTRQIFQSNKRMEVHKNYFSPYIAALSANLSRILPGELEVSYFPNSGAEAVEGAIKMAYKYHSGLRTVALHSDISFHGKLLGAAGFTGSPELHFEFPKIPGIFKFPYNDIEGLRETINRHRKDDGSSNIYALILEPLSASSMRECGKDFLETVRDICTKEDIVLIFDEVYTGWAKTGWLFNFMRIEGLAPDILTYAKSFGGGKSSISGYTARRIIAEKAYDNPRDATLHSTTYYGFGEEVATAITAVNEVINSDYVKRSQEIGTKFSASMKHFIESNSLINELRGHGGLWGITLKQNYLENIVQQCNNLGLLGRFSDPKIGKKLITGSIINQLYSKHDILTYFGSNHEIPLIVSFPLISGDEEVEKAAEALKSVFSSNLLKIVVEFAISRQVGTSSRKRN